MTFQFHCTIFIYVLLCMQLFLHVAYNFQIPHGFYNLIKTISSYIGQQYNDRIDVMVTFSDNRNVG